LKKRNVNFVTGIILAGVLLLTQIPVSASVPYNTYTRGPDNYLVPTQIVYEPYKVISLPLNAAEDIFFDEATGILFVADTGNSRILLVQDSVVVGTVGEGILERPSGVFVDDNGILYVADQDKRTVVVFDDQGKLLREIGRPTEPIFGSRNDFIPMKVAVDRRGNLYVVSKGSVDGVVQLSNDGAFLGYIGSNRTELTFRMLLRRLLFTEEQRERLFKKVPPSPTNITIGSDGLVYTVTEGLTDSAVKRLNIAGINIFPDAIISTDAMMDIITDEDGNIYALDRHGYLLVYDSFGNLLFLFGGQDTIYERVGLLRNPVAIDIDNNGYLFVLDKERSVIKLYQPTEFARMVMRGVDLYKQGLYVDGHAIWNDILRMNSAFILAYAAIAKSYFRQGDYDNALENFRLAEDRASYSDAFWQVRNFWIQENMADMLLILLAFLILIRILRYLNKRMNIFKKPKFVLKSIHRLRILRELRFMFSFFKNPVDAFYDMRFSGSASILSATVLYILLFAIQILRVFITGFSFADAEPEDVSLFIVFVTTFAPLALFIVSNYLVSTISDGEGRFKDVYIGTIYSLSPYLVLSLPVYIVSNILTLNEVFIYDFTLFAAAGWSLLLLVLMVKEVHNYTVRETIRNIAVTAFSGVVIVLVLFILFILSQQVFDFVGSIIQEVRIRV